MGEVDMAKERPNVVRMKILGAKVVPATDGLKTLKEAVDAPGAYMQDPVTQFTPSAPWWDPIRSR